MTDYFEVDCGELESYLNVGKVILLNRAVTDPGLLEDVYEGVLGDSVRDFVEEISSSERSSLEVSREEDYFVVINGGVLESLLETRLKYECGKNNDVIFLMSKIMEVIAANQIFGEGNKRTAYLSGCLFLIDHQRAKLGLERLVIPVLDDELLELLSEVAVGKSSAEDLYSSFTGLREDLEKNLKEL